MSEAPAFLVSSSFMPAGHDSLQPYAEAVQPLMQKYGAEMVIPGHAGQDVLVLEDDWKKEAALTVVKFPSMERLKAFWNSKEYKKAKHLRTDVIETNFTVGVEGLKSPN